jgi:hypothetical protein
MEHGIKLGPDYAIDWNSARAIVMLTQSTTRDLTWIEVAFREARLLAISAEVPQL